MEDARMTQRVLVIDDHAGFRAGIRLALRPGVFDIVGEAHDGATGLVAAERLAPDVVLLDIVLPDIDGFEVARRLLGVEHPPRVVLISSRDASDYGGRVERSGASGFIPKARLSTTSLRAVLG
jgi:DNA-binding NarL/FixJ family response regulator